MTRLPEEDVAFLSEAIGDLRGGQPRHTLDSLKSLLAKFPQTSSLNYLAALAALQAGQPIAAESFVKESMRMDQRVSDSLALLAMLEKRKQDLTGEGKARAQELLRAAITADAANPNPHFELAMMLRDGNRREDARQELRAAQARLNPIDSHAVIESTVALMKLKDSADSSLLQSKASPRNLTASLSAAYCAMRRGQFPEAAKFLQESRAMTTPDVFHYLIGDPAFAPYRDRKETAAFWRQTALTAFPPPGDIASKRSARRDRDRQRFPSPHRTGRTCRA